MPAEIPYLLRLAAIEEAFGFYQSDNGSSNFSRGVDQFIGTQIRKANYLRPSSIQMGKEFGSRPQEVDVIAKGESERDK